MHALNVLEFAQITDRLAAHCETTLGAASARELKPSFNSDEVWQLLAITKESLDALARHQVPGLSGARDLRDALKRVSKGGVLGGQELLSVNDLLGTSRNAKAFFGPKREEYPNLSMHAESLIEEKELERVLSDAIDNSGELRDDASVALSGLRQKKKAATSRLLERIQSYTTGRYRDLLSDPIYTTRDGRYVVPLKAENRGKIRGIVHDSSASGQTIYVEPEEVVQISNQIREVEAAERVEELRILTQLSDRVSKVAMPLRGALDTLAVIDLHLAKARYGYEVKGTVPDRANYPSLEIQCGRHPLLDPTKVVPVDICVGKGHSVLITGPNTGGKTVAIKTVGLFVAMSQAGIPIPAMQAKLGVFSQVWADIGDEQSLEQSLSTFSAHLKNIADSLRWMKPGALVLLDEVGAGTDPDEGAALAKSILSEMHRRGATILASTHYGELKEFAYQAEGFENAAMEFDTKSLRPTYRLIVGAAGASHALRIAERYGIPKEVVEAAKLELGADKQEIANMLERLETAQKQARAAQSGADRRTDELKKAEERAKRKLAEADEIRSNVHAKANEVIETALRELRLDAERLFDEIKLKPNDQATRDRVRADLQQLQEVGRSFAKEYAPVDRREPSKFKVERGMAVKIAGYSQPGTVIEEPSGGKVLVQAGILKIKVDVRDLSPMPASSVVKARSNVRLQKAMNVTSEITLRMMRAEDAEHELAKFIDDAVLAGLPKVRIVHGKGTGVLRKLTQDFLRKNPNVREFRLGDTTEGGDGVTIASFE